MSEEHTQHNSFLLEEKNDDIHDTHSEDSAAMKLPHPNHSGVTRVVELAFSDQIRDQRHEGQDVGTTAILRSSVHAQSVFPRTGAW